jgi:hypothetical protein
VVENEVKPGNPEESLEKKHTNSDEESDEEDDDEYDDEEEDEEKDQLLNGLKLFDY